MSTVRVIGPGRAGMSLASALATLPQRWQVLDVLGRDDMIATAADDADVVVIATPDDTVADVARSIVPSPSTVVVHLSGSLGIDVLAPHAHRASLHPLVPLPTPEVGASRLLSGATFAVAGDPIARLMAESLGGRVVVVDDDHRIEYHAAACIAANHVVAVLGQVERVARIIDLDLDVFIDLARLAVEDAAAIGPRAALTGPAARGDVATIERHRAAIVAMPDGAAELAGYDAGVALARQLVEAVA